MIEFIGTRFGHASTSNLFFICAMMVMILLRKLDRMYAVIHMNILIGVMIMFLFLFLTVKMMKIRDIIILFSSSIDLSLLIHYINRIFTTGISKSLISCGTLLALLLLQLYLIHHFAMKFFFSSVEMIIHVIHYI